MIYISLTTVPDRMNFERSARINLLSLLTQNTEKEFRVLYNVPKKYVGKIADNTGLLPQSDELGEDVKIPDWIEKLTVDYPKLIVNRTKDYGPVTKIVGALLYTQNDDDIIIVCDDDHEYHPDMLEYHFKKQTQYKNCAIAFRGDRLCEKREWVKNGKKHWLYVQTPEYYPVRVDQYLNITGHWHSVSYKRSFFKEDFLDEDFLFKNHWSDDILVAYYVVKHGLEIVCAAWDKETDFRLVNQYDRDCCSFPIVRTLPFLEAGCFVLRTRSGKYTNDQATYPSDWVEKILNYYASVHVEVE